MNLTRVLVRLISLDRAVALPDAWSRALLFGDIIDEQVWRVARTVLIGVLQSGQMSDDSLKAYEYCAPEIRDTACGDYLPAGARLFLCRRRRYLYISFLIGHLLQPHERRLWGGVRKTAQIRREGGLLKLRLVQRARAGKWERYSRCNSIAIVARINARTRSSSISTSLSSEVSGQSRNHLSGCYPARKSDRACARTLRHDRD